MFPVFEDEKTEAECPGRNADSGRLDALLAQERGARVEVRTARRLERSRPLLAVELTKTHDRPSPAPPRAGLAAVTRTDRSDSTELFSALG